MAEISAPAPAGAAAPGQDVLLATKLYVPREQPGFVPRPRLVEALDEGLARGLVLVCAPAGCGKTVLLADWARRGRWPVAWLSLDAADNDPARFWRHVIAALDRARPEIGERVGSLLGPPAPSSFEGLVTALINELAAQSGQDEVLLVLDDYHLIGADQVHAPLQFLVEHLPPGLHLVLASRSDPPLPLARLRARGQLAELRGGNLRFTQEEAAALLGEAVGGQLPAAAVAGLAARTEGWAAGLQLAALSLRGQVDPAGFVAAFSGSHRYVLDYLTEEVLGRQGEQVRTFLLETSVLDRLSGGLCDAVTGRPGSQAMLEQVERANLFLVPLDEVRGWWRYHHLFADLLRARLREQQPGRVAALHRNAAAWCEEHGLADDAVQHALASGDSVWAARLIERHFDEIFYLRGEGATVRRWLAALPAELAGSRPRLLLAQALLALASGRVETAGPPLDAAERAFAQTPDEPFGSTVGRQSWLLNVPATVTTQRAYLAALRGEAAEAAAFASRALAETGEDEWMLESIARWNLALAEWLHGRLAEAECALRLTISRWRAVGEPGLGRGDARSPRPGSARPRPPGGGARHLSADAGDHRASRRPGHPRCGRRARGHGRGGISAERARLGPAAYHRRRPAVPPVRLHPAAGQGHGYPGLDPAGQRRSGRGAGSHRTGRTGRGGPGRDRSAQPCPRTAGAAAAGPGRPRRSRPLGAAARPQPRRRAGLPAGAGIPGAGPGPAGPRPSRPRARAAGAAARGGGRPGQGGQRHRNPGAAGARVCGDGR